MPQNSGKKRRAAGPKAQTGGSNRKRRRTEPLAETS